MLSPHIRSLVLPFAGMLAVSVFLGAGCTAPSRVAYPTPSAPTTPPAPTAPVPAPQPSAAEPVKPSAATSKPTAMPKPKPAATAAPTPKPNVAKALIENFAFSPQVLAIQTGDSVVWTNKDGAPHTTVSDNAIIWDSGNLNLGQSFTRVFTSPGTYTYHCGVHPYMTGTIIVRDAVK